MSRCSKSPGASFQLALVLVVTSAVATPSLAGSGRAPVKVKVAGIAGIYVRQAVLGAQERLADARCGEVLSDFKSESTGQTLASELAGKNATTASGYLGAIQFVDGSEKRVCATGQAFAGMVKSGDDVVYVCPSRFRELVQRDAQMAEAVVIHEMLHTLGLGENPPTSLEITARVMDRCVTLSGPRTARR